MNKYAIFVFGLLLLSAPIVSADDKESNAQGMKDAMHKINEEAKAAREEERALREQIKEAKKAGDDQKVKELRGQLKTMHKENVQDMRAKRKDKVEDFRDRRENHRDHKHHGGGGGGKKK